MKQLPDDLGKLTEWMLKEFGPPKPFKPHAFYNQDGDMMEFWFEDVQSYHQWIPPGRLELILAQDDDRIVGLVVHGARQLALFPLPLPEEDDEGRDW